MIKNQTPTKSYTRDFLNTKQQPHTCETLKKRHRITAVKKEINYKTYTSATVGYYHNLTSSKFLRKKRRFTFFS